MFDERTDQMMEAAHVPHPDWTNKSPLYFYWLRCLYERLTSTIEFTIPENWDRQFFYLVLFSFGYMPVFETKRWGVTYMNAYPNGYNWFYQPVYMQVSNPKFTKRLEIGKDCEVLRLTNDWVGVWDILSHYATLLEEASLSMKVALRNSRMPLILRAHSGAQAETLKKVKNNMNLGDDLIIYDDQTTIFQDEMIPEGDEPFQSFINDLKKNYLGTELLENIDKILNQFYQEIGIVTAENTSHGKSHTLEIEAEQSDSQTQARLDTWMTNLEESCEKINAMFNIGLEVKKRDTTVEQRNAVADRDREISEQSE